jgi:hypothetical protein
MFEQRKFWVSRSAAAPGTEPPPTKTQLMFLRICNSLLRRLSKSTNTIFCGEVLMLMTHVFPFDARSGLNLDGSFNTTNVTTAESGMIRFRQSFVS